MFANSPYYINPGLAQTFPWLSGIAAQYQQYKFNGLLFEYKSTSGNAVSSTNAALGTVAMATNYNVISPVFVNKREILTTEFASVAPPSSDVLHPIECKRSQTSIDPFFVRTAAPVVGSDDRFNDMGLFQIATEGMQAVDVTLGELWVTYDVTFYKPIGVTRTTTAHYHFNAGEESDLFGLNAVAPTLWNGGSIPPTIAPVYGFPATHDNIGLSFSTYTDALGYLHSVCNLPNTLPSGNYMLSWTVLAFSGPPSINLPADYPAFFYSGSAMNYVSCSVPTFLLNGTTSTQVVPLDLISFGYGTGPSFYGGSPGNFGPDAPNVAIPSYANTIVQFQQNYTRVVGNIWAQNPGGNSFTQEIGFTVLDSYEYGNTIDWFNPQGVNPAQAAMVNWPVALPVFNCNASGAIIPGALNGTFFMYRLPDIFA